MSVDALRRRALPWVTQGVLTEGRDAAGHAIYSAVRRADEGGAGGAGGRGGSAAAAGGLEAMEGECAHALFVGGGKAGLSPFSRRRPPARIAARYGRELSRESSKE